MREWLGRDERGSGHGNHKGCVEGKGEVRKRIPKVDSDATSQQEKERAGYKGNGKRMEQRAR